jgi:ABC-2 type transport system permease protein
MMFSVALILEGLLGISFKGDLPMMIAAGVLLIVAYLAIGALLQLLVRDLATGLGLTGIVVSPAFGYAGVGFPTFGMNAFAQFWGALLPLRWYMAVLMGQAARGLPVADSARPFAALAALAVIYTLLALCACMCSREARSTRRSRRNRHQSLSRRAGSAARSRGSGGACSQIAERSFCWYWRRWCMASTTRSRISTRSCARSRSPSLTTI